MTMSVTRPCFTAPTRPRPRPIFWSQTGLVLRPTVSDSEHITGHGQGAVFVTNRSLSISMTPGDLEWQSTTGQHARIVLVSAPKFLWIVRYAHTPTSFNLEWPVKGKRHVFTVEHGPATLGSVPKILGPQHTPTYDTGTTKFCKVNTSERCDRAQNQMFKTKTFIFVLEAPRDQDPGLEDYVTALYKVYHAPRHSQLAQLGLSLGQRFVILLRMLMLFAVYL